jgi:hypothetical protein
MRLSSKVHTDLIKIQAEFGARHTYRQATNDIKSLTGNDRAIINRSRIHRTTTKVGKILEDNANAKQDKEELQPSAIGPSKKLSVAVDGGHVHDANNKGHNFEAMIAKVYRPENVIRVDKHHTEITKKHCVGSAKYDQQETMKANVIEAAKKEGLDKCITEVTVLADGAKNCWNIAEALRNLCCVFICILDWFHIGKYAQTLKTQLPAEYGYIIDEAKAELWLGQSDAALHILNKLQYDLKSEEHIRKVNNFSEYIKENREHITNYDERKNQD